MLHCPVIKFNTILEPYIVVFYPVSLGFICKYSTETIRCNQANNLHIIIEISVRLSLYHFQAFYPLYIMAYLQPPKEERRYRFESIITDSILNLYYKD